MPFATNGAVKLAYQIDGSGPPVLLIMGLGANRKYWEPQIQDLQQHFQLISFDNRGVGESTVPSEKFSMADLADDAVAILDELGIEQADVVGVSMGGMIAQHLVLNHPARVRRLALCVTNPGQRYAPPTNEVLQVLLMTHGKTREEVTRDNVKILFTPETIEQQPEVIERFCQLSIANAPPFKGFMFQTLASMEHDVLEQLREVEHQTLVLHAADDVLIPPRNGELLAEALPNSQLVMLEGTGHLCLLDRAADVNGILLDFLSSH